MKRLKFPAAAPAAEEALLTFPADWAQLGRLGDPHYVERDGMCTTGEPWYYWDFEADDGLRLSILYPDSAHIAMASSDPPDADRLQAVLEGVGIRGPFERFQPVPARTSGCAWLFFGRGAVMPTAVFPSKAKAEEWIRKEGFSGMLMPYAVGVSRYRSAVRSGCAEAANLPREQQQTFVGAFGERYEYEGGALQSGFETWLLYRQDDNGVKAVIREFEYHPEAVAALQEFEHRGHKQMYWIEEKPLSGTCVHDAEYRMWNVAPAVPRGR
jgi:hypothetical protein